MAVTIQPVTSAACIRIVENLALEIWSDHYESIIGEEQVDYMLARFQSFAAIREQLDMGQLYYLALVDGRAIGYLAVIIDPAERSIMISKLYVVREMRGRGVGTGLLGKAVSLGTEHSLKTLWLTVNRGNSSAIEWYVNRGLKVSREIDADIGNGFFMNDFVMSMTFED